jgi:radical SAM superfamily enzyme YgiQ (UPF0313 family)
VEPHGTRLPRISLHALPPFLSDCPLPAIGYLRGYLETHRPGISVTSAYWNQAIWKLIRSWVDERIGRGGPESYYELFDAVFARLYLLAAESPADASAIEFLQNYGAIFLDSQALEGIVELGDRISSFFDEEARRLRLETMDIIGASVMHHQVIPALAFLRHAKRRLRTPLCVLGGFPTAHDAQQIMDAFPFLDIAVFGDGEQTLLALCDAWPDPAALEGLPGTVVRRGDRVVENSARGFVNAPEMAFADYEGFDWSEKSVASDGALCLPICNARGCPWGKCGFCILNSRLPQDASARRPESVLAETRQHLMGIRKTSQALIQIHFLGNEIIGRGQGISTLVELFRGLVALQEEFGKLSVFGELSPVHLTEEVACLLNRLDATLQLGFEQWSRVVQLAHKQHRIVDGVHALKLLERYPNLHLAGFNLLLGYPGETLADVAETKSNLWRLKYILAPLARRNGQASPQGGLSLLNPRTLRMMQVALPPEIVRQWDFDNPFVRENAAHRPWTVLLGMMCGEGSLVLDYASRNQFFEAYDTTATAGLQRRLVARLEGLLEECSIGAYRNPDGLLELLLVAGRHRLAVPLEDCLLRILHETREIVSRTRLAERLADVPADELEEGIALLVTAELLYVSPGDRRLINTLPAHIQAEVDVAALNLHQGGGNGPDGSGTELTAHEVLIVSSDGAARDKGPAACGRAIYVPDREEIGHGTGSGREDEGAGA